MTRYSNNTLLNFRKFALATVSRICGVKELDTYET